jgi:hypothetical protein
MDSEHQVLDLHKIRGSKLIVYMLEGRPSLESYNLASALQYVQEDTVRKMITIDWTNEFKEDEDFVLVRDESTVRAFEAQFAAVLGLEGGFKKPMRASRGRLFLLEPGVKKLLARCSRPGREAVRLALGKVFASFRAPDLEPIAEIADHSQGGEAMSSLELGSAADSRPASAFQITDLDASLSLEERRFRYDALQTLLRQLQELEAPHLQQLAIEAAEVALDRSLTQVRVALEDPGDRAPGPRSPADPPTITSPGAVGHGGIESNCSVTPVLSSVGIKLSAERSKVIGSQVLEGPRFSGNGYFSLTQIGERAGGYSARTAGLAADVVAGRMGLSHESIRNIAHNFNKIVEVPDTTSGKKRPSVVFNTSFSNDVIDELRRNPEFHPRELPRMTGFTAKSFPKLNHGPFEDDEKH